MIRILILSLSLSSILAEVVSNNLRSDSVNDQPSQNSNELLTSSSDSSVILPIIIGVSVWVIFNLFGLCVIRCMKKYALFQVRVQKGLLRQNFGQRYPQIRFQGLKGYISEEEIFYGRDCYQIGEVVSSVPAFIYGRDIAPEVNQLGDISIYQCQNCRGLTKTLEVFKYGKLQSCSQKAFLLIFLPCFLASTIYLLTANRILWQKFFCAECGLEKMVYVQSRSSDNP